MPGYRHFASNVLRSLVLAACISLLGSLAISLPAAAAPVPARSSVQQGRARGNTVDVDLVVFNVAVTEGKGRHVSALRASDFYVYEENLCRTTPMIALDQSRPARSPRRAFA